MRQKRLFFDMFICKYFESTFEDVMKAELQLNRALNIGKPVSVRVFYETLGVDELDFDSVFERDKDCVWAGFDHKLTMVDQSLECVILSPPFIMLDGRVHVYSNTRRKQ